jgi:hypothetical protein
MRFCDTRGVDFFTGAEKRIIDAIEDSVTDRGNENRARNHSHNSPYVSGNCFIYQVDRDLLSWQVEAGIPTYGQEVPNHKCKVGPEQYGLVRLSGPIQSGPEPDAEKSLLSILDHQNTGRAHKSEVGAVLFQSVELVSFVPNFVANAAAIVSIVRG